MKAQHVLFETLYNTYNSFKDKDFILWAIEIIQVLQQVLLGMAPVVEEHWSPASFYDFISSIHFLAFPQRLVNGSWTFYVTAYGIISGLFALRILLILFGMIIPSVRSNSSMYKILLKGSLSLCTFLLALPAFLFFSDPYNCQFSGGELVWTSFPDKACFSGVHIVFILVSTVVLGLHTFFSYYVCISFWDNRVKRETAFSKYSCKFDLYRWLGVPILTVGLLLAKAGFKKIFGLIYLGVALMQYLI